MKSPCKSLVINRIIDWILNFFFGIFYNLFIKRKVKKHIIRKKYYFTICAMFKDEGPFLKEWVEYHRLIGVDHIYLYNNNSTDDFRNILAPYIQEDYVTLTDWPELYSQLKIYHHCYNAYRSETNWIAFIDLDEFICPKYCTDIKEYARNFEGYPAVFMFWRMFGTAGVMEHDYSKPVIEQYTTCWEEPDCTGKYFVSTNESFQLRELSVHRITVWVDSLLGRTPTVPITDSERFIFFPFVYRGSEKNRLLLNHYFSKSYSLFQKKIHKGDIISQYNEKIRNQEGFFYMHERNNIVKNYVIFRFITKLKIQLNK